MNGDRAPVSRCIVVWLLVSAGCVALLRWLGAGTELRSGHEVTFDQLLPRLASLALACCAVWFWWVTTWTALAAARGVIRTGVQSTPGCPRPVQRLILAACGLALVGAGGPAVADQAGRTTTHASPTTSILVGLPLPDRASSERPPSSDVPAPSLSSQVGQQTVSQSASDPRHRPDGTLVVRPGDTLWALAADALPDGASDAEITAAWHALYDANRDLIADPDLIFPGTRLQQPTQEES